MTLNNLSGKRLMIVQAEKGGVGKTTIVDALAAGLQAINTRVLVVDCDDGNSGYLRRSGPEGAIPLPWATGPEAAAEWCERHFKENDIIIIDCGANLLASAQPVTKFLGELILKVADRGGTIAPIAIASTNAPGVDRLVLHMRDTYSAFGKVCLVQNDQDGSGAFPTSLATLGLPTARFPYIGPGIMAARLLSRRPLLRTLQEPPEDYAIALGYMARHVARFLETAAISALLTPAAAQAIHALSDKAAGHLEMVVPHLKAATDSALRANAACFQTTQNLYRIIKADPGDHAAIAQAAIEWLEAHTR